MKIFIILLAFTMLNLSNNEDNKMTIWKLIWETEKIFELRNHLFMIHKMRYFMFLILQIIHLKRWNWLYFKKRRWINTIEKKWIGKLNAPKGLTISKENPNLSLIP